MKKSGAFPIILILLTAVILMVFSTGCNKEFRKLEKSEDWKKKLDGAMRYYEAEDYYRATILLEQILPITRGMPEGEQVQFYFAYCHYRQGLYILASHHFKTFYETYARSEFVEEARFMYAHSLYLDSPSYNLDQTSSFEAIRAMQNFINRFPRSQYREQASDAINELQTKLERKAYEASKQYLKLSWFKSAIVAFENFKDDFPDSEFNEEIAFLKIEAIYKLANRSIFSKQEERYRETIKYYEEFIDMYPNSKYLRVAEKYYAGSLDFISDLMANK